MLKSTWKKKWSSPYSKQFLAGSLKQFWSCKNYWGKGDDVKGIQIESKAFPFYLLPSFTVPCIQDAAKVWGSWTLCISLCSFLDKAKQAALESTAESHTCLRCFQEKENNLWLSRENCRFACSVHPAELLSGISSCNRALILKRTHYIWIVQLKNDQSIEKLLNTSRMQIAKLIYSVTKLVQYNFVLLSYFDHSEW